MPRYIAILFALPLLLSCFCIFMCKPNELEIKKTDNIDKPLNLSLLFGEYSYPYSINIVNDSITFLHKRIVHENKEYRDKLTDEQYAEIKKMVSALNQEYEFPSRGPYGAWNCILEIDNQVHYKYVACDGPPEFSRPGSSPPMPKEIKLLFQYIVDLSPFRIM